MDERKRRRLESAGWVVGTVEDFLGLTPDELAYIDMSLALSRMLKEWREQARITKQALARKLKATPSHVSKMEDADPSITIDMLVRALLVAGATPEEIGRAFAPEVKPQPLRRVG